MKRRGLNRGPDEAEGAGAGARACVRGEKTPQVRGREQSGRVRAGVQGAGTQGARLRLRVRACVCGERERGPEDASVTIVPPVLPPVASSAQGRGGGGVEREDLKI